MISGKNASGWLIRACRHSSILARPSYRSRIGVDTSPSPRTRSEDMSTSKSGGGGQPPADRRRVQPPPLGPPPQLGHRLGVLVHPQIPERVFLAVHDQERR